MSTLRERVLHALIEAGRPMTLAEIAALIPEWGVPSVNTTIAQEAKAGHLVRAGKIGRNRLYGVAAGVDLANMPRTRRSSAQRLPKDPEASFRQAMQGLRYEDVSDDEPIWFWRRGRLVEPMSYCGCSAAYAAGIG